MKKSRRKFTADFKAKVAISFKFYKVQFYQMFIKKYTLKFIL
jgi:hypothetical protein